MTRFLTRGTLRAIALCAVAASPALAADPQPASTTVTVVRTATVTDAGQPIVLPPSDVRVTASIYEIPAGATLPVHKHLSARYAYVLSGDLRVTNHETGETRDYQPGDFVIEMIDTWHLGANIGADPVRLLVIDQVQGDAATVILQH
jgi:quercetin dioxygenase-like cupin family protein